MNRVFFSGRLQAEPDIAYTPKGERIVVFPLWVEEGSFRIDVVFVDQRGSQGYGPMTGKEVVVSGTLAKSADRTHGAFRVKANKILWMEE